MTGLTQSEEFVKDVAQELHDQFVINGKNPEEVHEWVLGAIKAYKVVVGDATAPVEQPDSAEFESWSAKEYSGRLPVGFDRNLDELYIDHRQQELHEAWQAARAGQLQKIAELESQVRELTAQRNRLEKAMRRIASEETECKCDHTDQYCCEVVGYFCLKCFVERELSDMRKGRP